MNTLLRLMWTLLIFGIISCESKTKTTETVTPSDTNSTQTTSNINNPIYPGLTQDLGMKIWNEGEMIDYLFHDLPFSMSQDEQASIQTNMTYISADPVYSIPAGCKPMARQFYQVGGDIILEGDIYHGNGCHFYIFLENGKPTYANQMNQKGIAFFNNIVKQAMQAREGGPG